MKTKLRFVYETTESISVRRTWRTLMAYCPRCDSRTAFETPEGISAKTGIDERETFRLVEAQAISFLKSDRIFVCSRCLSDAGRAPCPETFPNGTLLGDGMT